MDIGLNLYSLRNQIKDEKAFLKTMETLREIGISFVQYSGADFASRIFYAINLSRVLQDRVLLFSAE